MLPASARASSSSSAVAVVLFFLPYLVDDQETIYLPCPDMLTTHGRRPRTGSEVWRLRLVQNQNSRDLAAVFAIQMI